jgi:glycosyltransferase involved in cell wall biosynthesis
VNYLLKKSNGAVFLNSESRNLFAEKLKSTPSAVISEGSILHPFSNSTVETRRILKVPQNNLLLVLVGSLEEYKGIDLVFSKISKLPRNVSIRIAGTSPEDYQRALSEMKSISEKAGIDIDIKFGFLSDEEFGEYLEAADFFLYPCRTINNSGSLNAALTHGLPVIVPRVSSLNWVPENCKVYINGETPEEYDLENTILALNSIGPDVYRELSTNAMNYSKARSWSDIAKQYKEFYEDILKGS